MHDVSPAAKDAEGIHVTVGIPTRNRPDLLRKAIASVLEQNYRGFTLLVSDNGPNEETATAAASFEDPRIVYRPLDPPVERAANYNGLVETAETEFVVLLADDDELHPDHLSMTVDALRRWPSAGLAHTGYLMIDTGGKILAPHNSPFKTKEPLVLETGSQFLERSMRKSGPTVSFSSITFRKAAFVDGGSLREEDGVSDDFPLLMRIATSWDFVYVNRPLAMVRAHKETSSSELGSFTPGGFRSSRSAADVLYENRRKFLSEAELPDGDARRFARFAERRFRHDVLSHLSMRSDSGDGPVTLFKALWTEIRRDPRLALDPLTLRFVAGQLGGRWLRDLARRADRVS